MTKVITDSQKIDWALAHGVERVYPSPEALRDRLIQGARMTIYNGIDPTASYLHLGNAITLKKLREFQDLGHRIILVIGDFTAMSGDPDKLVVRRQLTREEVLENCHNYQEQAGAILRFDGANPAELKFNSAWLSTLTFKEVIELASHFTVQQMLERDNFQKRLAEQKPIKLHEFFYPLMQGYDSVAMDVDLEIGGNDQTFNMLAGRDLMRDLKHKEKFVLTMRLLVDAGGKKMGKTEGNAVALNDAPEEMYGKIMSWTDEMILPGFTLVTDASAGELSKIEKALQTGENPMTFKRLLAERIVAWLRGPAVAEKAAEHFTRIHQHHDTPEKMKELRVKTDAVSLVDVLVESGLVPSKTEARRQIEQSGIKVNDVVVTDVKAIVSPAQNGTVIQKGKRHFVKIVEL